jgi:hypothetical protein
MAKISVYPKATPPSLDDFVVGTDVSDSLATKSFLISDILSLGVNFPPTLQQVTTAGATTNKQIVVSPTTGHTPITGNSILGGIGLRGNTDYGWGVWGYASANGGQGVRGVADGASSRGVRGESSNGVGVSGQSDNNIGISGYSANGVSAVFEVPLANISNIAQFKKSGVNQAFISHDGNITANSFIKSGGTSSQFLKANGSIDSNTYALASAVPSIPYKVYSALISQSGTSAPTLVVLQNTLGDTITPLYNSVGNYTLRLDALNLFTSTKTFILLNSSYNTNAYLGIVRGDDSQLLVNATFNGSNSNNVISDASIEIRVYN